MRRCWFVLVVALIFSCNNSGNIENISWLIGNWSGQDLNDLVFHESWSRESKTTFDGYGATVSPEGDTVFRETLKIDVVDGTPYFVTTIPKVKGPVLFKMIKGDSRNAIFENKEHDFPKRISYLLETNNSFKLKLEGIDKGVPRIETLTYERDNGIPFIDAHPKSDSEKRDTVIPTTNIHL